MTTVALWLFWLSLAGLIYIYAGYPLLIWLLGRAFPRSVAKREEPRTVSVVIVVHNEARHIARKLDSIRAMEHAEWITEILIGSDGSTDETAALVQSDPDLRLTLFPFVERRGKPAVLNELLSHATGEIVLLTDARQDLDPRCLVELTANFADNSVGVVSGELVLRRSTTTTTAAEGIGFYWTYEKFLRKAESRFRGVPGATGACYAIRRNKFRPIPPETILDDVAIPLTIVAQQQRCLFEPLALAFDDPSTSSQQEAVRKRRTIAGAAQLVRLYPQWLWPSRQPLWFELASHKLLRLVSPILLLIVLAANVSLLGIPFFKSVLALQGTFYLASIAGWSLQRAGRRSRLLGPALMFITLNWTTAQALWDACRSRYRVTWQKAA